MSIELPGNVLRAALLFAGKNDVRYYLNGVYVDTRKPDRLDIVATEGHCMFVHRVALKKETPEELRREWVLGRDDLAAVARGAETVILIGADREAATVRVIGSGTARTRKQLVELIDGRFPDWERPFSKALHAPAGLSHLKPSYVGLCGKVEKVLCGMDSWRTVITTKADNHAAVVTFPDDVSMGLIMPMNHGKYGAILPEWAKQIPVFEDKKAKLKEAA